MRHNRVVHLAFSTITLAASVLLWTIPTAQSVQAATITQSAGCFSPVTSTWATFPLEISGTPVPSTAGNGDSVELDTTSLVVTVSSALIAAGVGAGVVSEGTNSVVSTVTLSIDGGNTSQGTQATTGTTDLAFDVAIDPVTAEVTIDPDPILGVVPLADSTWTATGGDIAFAASPGTAPAASIPTLIERNAAPIRILNKLNGALNANFYCWPGVATADGTALVAGGSTPIASVSVTGGSTTSSTSSTTSSTSSTTTSTSTSSTTFTTASPSTTTSTTSPVATTMTGSATYSAECTNSLTPDKSQLTFVLTGTVPSQVSAGQQVSLNQHTWAVTVPGSVLDAGIGLGLLEPGDTVAGTVTASVFASNTLEGTESSTPINVAFGPVTADPSTGLADPASASFSVDGLNWTTVGGSVGFSMASAKVGVAIGAIKITFTCNPADLTTAFVGTEVLGATGQQAAPRTATATTPATVLGATISQTSAPLARTGAEVLAPALLALALIDLGYLAQSAASPARRRRT